MNRRELLTSAGLAAGAGAAWSSLLAPVRAVAAEARPIRIKNIESFTIVLPATETEIQAGVLSRATVMRVETESGVRGYAFNSGVNRSGAAGRGAPSPAAAGRGAPPAPAAGRGAPSPPAAGRGAARPGASFQQVREALIGADLFAMEQHLKRGLVGLPGQGGLEEALWDAIGKVAGQPVYRLLGGAKTSIPVYITAVWPGPMDQSQVPIKDQAAYARRLKDAGFNGFKMRIFRPNFMDDVESAAGIIAACGPAPGFKTMVDRTAHIPGSVWDYATGLAAARALEAVGVYWLEEPFARDDFETPARLAREVDITITGGEGWHGLDPFREGLVHETYDVFQPDLNTCGGLLTIRKIAALCEAFHKPCIGHGSFGLNVAGRIQAHAAWGAPLEEMALATPPLLPQEQWAPALKILKSKELYTFRNGEVQVPQCPGLGLDLDEDAIEHYRV
jgi:D-galactarolactone cycloisomerase